jgi:hypothetical protein
MLRFMTHKEYKIRWEIPQRGKARLRRACPGDLSRRSFLTAIAIATAVNEDGSLQAKTES